MQKGESGLGYSNEASMYIGYSDVKEHANFTRFESLLIEQLHSVVADSKIVKLRRQQK